MVKLGDRFVLGYKKGLSVDYVSFGIRMDKVSLGKKKSYLGYKIISKLPKVPHCSSAR